MTVRGLVRVAQESSRAAGEPALSAEQIAKSPNHEPCNCRLDSANARCFGYFPDFLGEARELQ